MHYQKNQKRLPPFFSRGTARFTVRLAVALLPICGGLLMTPRVLAQAPQVQDAANHLRVVFVDTSDASGQNQTRDFLENVAADVETQRSGALDLRTYGAETILVWRGARYRNGDWEQVEAFLRRGGALLWYGAALPFSQLQTDAGIVDSTAKGHSPDDPASILTQGQFQSVASVKSQNPPALSAAGKAIWNSFSPPAKMDDAHFLTLNDSIYLHTNWPWVKVTPLVQFDYSALNWIQAERTFTGSTATLFTHSAGEFAGARVLLATGGDDNVPVNGLSREEFLRGAIQLLARPIAVEKSIAKPPVPSVPLTRANFFIHPQKTIAPLDFSADRWDKDDVRFAARRVGFNTFVAAIPWRVEVAPDGSVIDWARTDTLMAQAKKGGWTVVFDPYNFSHYRQYAWARDEQGRVSIYNPAFAAHFQKAMKDLTTRYAKNPTLVALFATRITTGFGIDDSTAGKAAWASYASTRNLAPGLPQVPAADALDTSPTRAAYIEFQQGSEADFVRTTIRAIRAVAPEMPLLLRGNYVDVAGNFRLASEFKNVAPHCESVETSIDVEGVYRGFAARYGVPISAENGWPKERGAAIEMAFATTLMGGYSDFMYSFAGPLYARPSLSQFEDFQKVWPVLRGARYKSGTTALLIPDSTMWASQSPGFQSFGPSNRLLMERSGFSYSAVSAQWPKLDGLKLLVCAGNNEVLTQKARAALIAWIRSGGTFVAFSPTGSRDAAGAASTLAGELGIDFTPGTKSVGLGKVIVFAQVPASEIEEAAFLRALEENGATRPVTFSPAINSATFAKNGKTIIVLYDKNINLLGSFFTESAMSATLKSLPTRVLSVHVPADFSRAREVRSNTALTVQNRAVQVVVPGDQWRVIEFSP